MIGDIPLQIQRKPNWKNDLPTTAERLACKHERNRPLHSQTQRTALYYRGSPGDKVMNLCRSDGLLLLAENRTVLWIDTFSWAERLS